MKEIEAHNRALELEAAAHSIDYVRVQTSAPPDSILSAYLAKRESRARGGKH